jgi:hypothetical protein
MQQQRGVGGGASEHTPHQVGQVVANLVVKYGNIEFEWKLKVELKTKQWTSKRFIEYDVIE